MSRWAALALLAATAVPAWGCGDSLGNGARRIEDAQFLLVYKLAPEPVPVGRHFSIDFALCTRGAAALPAEVRVDAQMPEHKHGMNYRPSVAPRGPGQYRAEGLMFHMPGRWELSFELHSPGAPPKRLAQSLQVG
jgi:hypothetical protein